MSVHVCKRLLTTCDSTKTFTQSACYGGHAASLWQLLTQTNACHHLDVPSSNSNFSQAAPLENWHGQPTGQLPHSKALTFERSEAWDANVRLCTSQAFPFCCKIIAKSIWNLLETLLIVQLCMFHHVTTFQQAPLSVTLCHYVPCAVWNTQSPTQNSYEHSWAQYY